MKQKTCKWLAVLTTALVFACSGMAFADEPVNAAGQPMKLSLQDAIDTAMKNNAQIGVQQLQVEALDVSIEEIESKIRSLGRVDFAYQNQDYYMATEIAPAKAKASREMAVKALDYTKNSIAFGVESAYYGVLKAEKNLEFAKASLERTNTQYKNAQASFKKGSVAKLDVLSAEANVKTAEVTVKQAENGVTSAKMELAQLMGVPLTTELTLTTGLTPRTAGNIDLGAAIEKGLETDVSVATAKLNMTNSELDLQHTGYTYASKSYNYMKDEATHKSNVIQYDEAKKTLEKNVRNAYNNLATTAGNMEGLNKSLELAKESYRLTLLQYDMGMATTYDVQNAEASLRQAELGWLDAIYNNNLANAKFTYGVYSGGM
ncbi:MAG: TolC family protein [Peptococcaceae bacterium]|jgi:outer membrane protein|nr:TolC family protein [Peptococcaceae bacterium]